MIKYLIFIILFFLFLVYRKNKINITEPFVESLSEINTIDELVNHVTTKNENNNLLKKLDDIYKLKKRLSDKTISEDNIDNILPNNDSTDINELELLYSNNYIDNLNEEQRKNLNISNLVVDFLYKNKKEKMLGELEESELAIIYDIIKNYKPTFTINNKINNEIPKEKYILKYELSLADAKISNYTYIPFDISLLPNNNNENNYFKDLNNNIEDLEIFLQDIKSYYDTNDKEDVEKMNFLKYENYKFFMEIVNNVDFNKLLKADETKIYNFKTDFLVFPSKLGYQFRNTILVEEEYNKNNNDEVKKLLNSETTLESEFNKLDEKQINIKSEKLKEEINNINGYILEKDENIKDLENNNKIYEIKKNIDGNRINNLFEKYIEKVLSQEGDLQNDDDKDKVKNIEIDNQKYTFYLDTYHNTKRLKYSYVILYLIYNELQLENNNNLKSNYYIYNRTDNLLDFYNKFSKSDFDSGTETDIEKKKEKLKSDVFIEKEQAKLEPIFEKVELDEIFKFIKYINKSSKEINKDNYNNLDSFNTFFTNIIENIKSEIQNIFENNRDLTKNKIKYVKYYKDFTISLGTEGIISEDLILKEMKPRPREIISKIQDILRLKLNNRGTNNEKIKKDIENKTEELKLNLKIIDQQRKKTDKGDYFMKEEPKDLKEIYKSYKYDALYFVIKDLNDKIVKGDLDFINYFLSFDIDNMYIFPNKLEIIESFENIKTDFGQKKMEGIYNRLHDMRNYNPMFQNTEEKKNAIQNKFSDSPEYSNNQQVEHFENYLDQPHKHQKTGTIDWNRPLELGNEEWLKKPENMDLVRDYNFIPEETKDLIMLNLADMEGIISDTTKYTDKIYKEFLNTKDKPKTSDVKKLLEEIQLQKLSNDEKNMYFYQKKEKEQEESLKNVNLKIDELQKIRNKVNEPQLYNSVSSYNGGQRLAVSNIEANMYNISVNGKCLGTKDGKLNVEKCSKNDNMKFEIKRVNSNKEYNSNIKDKLLHVDENSGIYYPFDLVKHNEKCLGLDGNNMFLEDCVNKKNQRFDASIIRKNCNKFSNL